MNILVIQLAKIYGGGGIIILNTLSPRYLPEAVQRAYPTAGTFLYDIGNLVHDISGFVKSEEGHFAYFAVE